MSRVLIIFSFLAAALLSQASVSAQTQSLEFAGKNWRIAAQKAEVTDHLDRSAIALTGGRLWLDSANFSDGVIRFDVAYQEQTIFVGASWRAENDGHYEEIYFRGHLNEMADALQYTPVENRNSAWQIFSDANAVASVSQSFTGWNQVKIVVQGDKADVYFNSLTPVLHIPDFKTELQRGAVALRSNGRNAGPAYFSNIVIRPLAAGEGIVGVAKPVPALPEGVIKQWSISSPIAEDRVQDMLGLDRSVLEGLSWNILATETNGIANLAKRSNPRSDGNTVFVRLNLRSDRDQMKEMTFGYSDRARVYLNGKRLFRGNAGWRVRDYRFLGTVGFFDAVGLDLKAGDNELLIAVSETFGGWAWAAALKDGEGIIIQ